jgi:ATP-dependent 26S proteasome regulatory subunit
MTVTDVERGLIARYLARVISRPDLPTRSARHVVYWLNERAESLGLPMPTPISSAIGSMYGTGFRHSEFERAYLSARSDLLRMLDAAATETPRPEPLASNVESLVLALGLSSPDAAWKIVGLIACCMRYEQIQYLANSVLECSGPIPRTIAYLIGEPIRVVDEVLSPWNDLIGSGLLQLREGDLIAGHAGRYAIPFRINACLDRSFADFAAMRDALLGTPLASAVGMSDYEHVASDRDLIVAVLRGGADAGAQGINVLLYGSPGAGKTELAKVAARAAGLALFAAGEDTRDVEYNRSARLADLVFSERLLAGEHRTALLFDEMEDVAVHLISRGGSKVYLNRLLETNPVPIVWTSNELANIDPALLRRMTLAIELKRPPAAQRKRIIGQLLQRAGLALPDPDVERLAQRLDATPAIIENAIRAARFAGGGPEIIERAARGIMRAVSGVAARRLAAIPAFDPGLTTASRDLIALADQLVGGRARAFSLCLYGPPGTGKSAFARYLAGRLGLEVLQKRASDILGPYLGQSERNIADAFEEAREAGAFLVFDEADSLLLDRRDAQRSWEITQVNEMLTWMEEHPLPVCFTTNLMERIDQASLRRFTFNVRFDYLDRAGLERAWRVFFGLDAPPPDGLAFTNLTPGDFAKARKQAEVLGIVGNPDDLVELIADISRAKPGASGSLGFMG